MSLLELLPARDTVELSVAEEEHLVQEQRPSKNLLLTPDGILARAGKKVRKRVSVYTALTTTHPTLAAQWHPTKNLPLTPDQVFAGTSKKCWWQCERGHEWLATGNSRYNGSNCPDCGHRRVSIYTALATTHPMLASEWHPTKNLPLTPMDVMAGTNKRLWWKCAAKGHEWLIQGNSRLRGDNCPHCRNQRVSSSNSLATTHPALATEWHLTKNFPLTPDDVIAGTEKELWWKCVAKGHEWAAQGHSRKRGENCPYCSNQRVSNYNSMATTHPALAATWHPTKNLPITPHDIVASTSKRFWWQCTKGHEWLARGENRVRGQGCRRCRKQSGLEILGWSLLTALNLTFSKQHPIGKYHVDALVIQLAAQPIVVEFDGCYWHGCKLKYAAPTSRHLQARTRDARRDQRLTAQGYQVVRICEAELKQANKQGAGAQFLHSRLFPAM